MKLEQSPILEGIYIATKMGDPMILHERIRAIAGMGLEGDRYPNQGAFSAERTGKSGRIPDDLRQVSIISSIAIQQANERLLEIGLLPFSAAETRRNLLVDIDSEILNALVGKQFRIGEVTFEGSELCTPCTRPAILSGRKDDGKYFEKTFTDLGGIRARILSNGILEIGNILNPTIL